MTKFKSIIVILVLFSLTSISCSTTPMPKYGSVNVPADFFGIVHAGNTTEEYPLLNELGAEWILQTFYWSGIEKEPGNFDFSWYDFYVNTAKENNKKVIAVLAYATPWLDDGRNNRYISKNNIHHFLNYVEVTVERYKGKVDAWQIWNEPNWIFWRGPNKDFFELSRLAALKIRETDPDAFIIGGGFQSSPNVFIRQMFRAGAFENLDAISFHPYGFTPRGSVKLHDKFIKVIKKLKFEGEIWVTEAGYPTAGYYPSRVSLKNFPSYIVKTVAGIAARGPRVLMWYQINDPFNFGEYPNYWESELFFGLLFADKSKKDGAWAYELCARYLPGKKYMPDLPIREKIPSNIVTFCFMSPESAENNTNTLILWNDNNCKRNIRIIFDTSFELHDISSGNSITLPSETILEVTNKPMLITWNGNSAPRLLRK